ncbi:unnamed protein product [Blepharisma stoltei]|uniref:LNR domain-containing protein n=1 Tax=Blepharisma stoltei TaxID=1481888 RepID=A0AAU9JQW0_9CILI|nr:unnamed protein product [Blepharisma stoltei]
MEDCVNSTCATGCNTWMVGNSICDGACYVEECEYDKTDYICAPFCSDNLLKNGIYDEVCNNLNCKFDNGDCGYCNSECSEKMLANNLFDPEWIQKSVSEIIMLVDALMGAQLRIMEAANLNA